MAKPSTRPAATAMDAAKQLHPPQPHSECAVSMAAVPATVLAASHRASVKKSASSTTPVHSHHRRSQTIVVAGELEMDHIQKSKAVHELHTELESKSKALEESQEEAQLAARIGQTLLQRNREMGAESESKAIELQNRAESAEHFVRVLEKKLSLAVAQIRSLDMARTRATLEAEQLTHELEDSRTQVHALKGDCARAHDEIQRTHSRQERLEETLETTHTLVATLEATRRQLQADVAARKDRIQVLESVERYNVEHISRLEIENQSICQQQHVLAHREKQLRLENDALASKMASIANAMKEHQARNHELENAVRVFVFLCRVEAVLSHCVFVGLDGGVAWRYGRLAEALHAEQTRVSQLTQINQGLEARLDRERRIGDSNSSDEIGDDPSSRMLRHGSLFFELARQMRDEMQDIKSPRPASKAASRSPEETVADPVESGGLDSPARSSTRTSRNPSSNNTDSVDDDVDEATEPVRPCRPPPLPLQLERRCSQQEEAEIVRAAVAAAKSPRSLRAEMKADEVDNEGEEDDCLIKEFFVLTAAAVKIAGGGLRNDACNIHSEDLFAEAMAHHITFDQFHKWLERRLEDDLEMSLFPEKTVVDTKPSTSPTPSRGIIRFWSY